MAKRNKTILDIKYLQKWMSKGKEVIKLKTEEGLPVEISITYGEKLWGQDYQIIDLNF